MRNFSSVSIIL